MGVKTKDILASVLQGAATGGFTLARGIQQNAQDKAKAKAEKDKFDAKRKQELSDSGAFLDLVGKGELRDAQEELGRVFTTGEVKLFEEQRAGEQDENVQLMDELFKAQGAPESSGEFLGLAAADLNIVPGSIGTPGGFEKASNQLAPFTGIANQIDPGVVSGLPGITLQAAQDILREESRKQGIAEATKSAKEKVAFERESGLTGRREEATAKSGRAEGRAIDASGRAGRAESRAIERQGFAREANERAKTKTGSTKSPLKIKSSLRTFRNAIGKAQRNDIIDRADAIYREFPDEVKERLGFQVVNARRDLLDIVNFIDKEHATGGKFLGFFGDGFDVTAQIAEVRGMLKQLRDITAKGGTLSIEDIIELDDSFIPHLNKRENALMESEIKRVAEEKAKELAGK